MSRFRSAAFAAVVTAAVLVPAGAASAASTTVSDSGGDVWEATYDPESGTSSYEPVGSVANSDVKKSTVEHSAKRVEVTVKYAKLKKAGPGNEFFAELKGPDGTWVLGGYRDGADASAFLYQESSTRGEPSCEGLKASVDLGDDVLTVSAPRSCLGNPAWVKYHGTSVSYEYVDETSHTYIDNAHNDTHNHKGWTGKIKKG